MSKRETSSAIDDAAADWAVRIDESPLDASQQAEFDAWLEADVRRVGAFARAQAVLIHAKRAKALGSEFEPAAFASQDGGVANGAPQPARRAVSRRGILVGAAAAAASVSLAVFLPGRSASARIFQTGRGETRLIPLGNGSTVTLNTETKIAVDGGSATQRLELLSGEALFKIAPSHAGPVQVEARDISLRTDKATFAVQVLERRPFEVKVSAGNVALERSALLSHTKGLLHANMEATISPEGNLIQRTVSAEDLQRELTWQEGMLSFLDTPLSEAAAEFARYSDKRILIPDPSVGAETVTGRFSANDPEGFAEAVALGLGLSVRSTRNGIRLAH